MRTYDEAYAAGFCKVAEEFGIDGNTLLKYALNSTPANEVLLGLLPNLIPCVGPLSSAIGAVSGQIAEPSEEQRGAATNLLPGVASHRLTNRLKTQVLEQYRKHKVDGMGQLTSETIGSILPTTLISTGIGAGIGHLTGKNTRQKQKNTLIGAGIGAAAPSAANVIGAIIAGIKRRRTEEEQVSHDRNRSNIAKNMLIPGVGTYNRFKRLGRSQGDRDEKENNGSKKKTSKNK